MSLIRWRSLVNCRTPPAPMGALRHGAMPAQTGLTTGAPVRLRDLSSDRAGRLLARFAAEKDAAVNAPVQADHVVVVPVRLISATLVPGYWLDHSDPAHLKAAVGMFDGVPVYTMHWAWPDNWYGMVTEPEWDDAPLGADQVPGINGLVAIEGDLSERHRIIARGVSHRSLKRWSAGFLAEYHASHEDMSTWTCEDWWFRLGEVAPDGERYRFIVDRIIDVIEESLVDQGAIESAQTIAQRAPADLIAARTAPGIPTQPARPAQIAARRGPFVALPLKRQEIAP